MRRARRSRCIHTASLAAGCATSYRSSGTTLVLDVDPASRSVTAHAAEGVRRYETGERFIHPAVPWLEFDVADAFANLDR